MLGESAEESSSDADISECLTVREGVKGSSDGGYLGAKVFAEARR